MLRQLQINRQLVYDISASLLEPAPSLFQRLFLLASSRDHLTGRYQNDRLAGVHPAAAVHEALAQCHEEILECVLELPLELQEQDLRKCLEGPSGGAAGNVESWKDTAFINGLLPEGVPEYLKQLFRSNVRILVQILEAGIPENR
jgi:hypothetical protein